MMEGSGKGDEGVREHGQCTGRLRSGACWWYGVDVSCADACGACVVGARSALRHARFAT